MSKLFSTSKQDKSSYRVMHQVLRACYSIRHFVKTKLYARNLHIFHVICYMPKFHNVFIYSYTFHDSVTQRK